ncbi:DUF3419 family protein [Planctomycetaceae bacterium SH139]
MLKDWISQKFFHAVHTKNLVYNTCWEDPRLDRQALELNSNDSVLVITSAGCNALDYALGGPREVFAVDMNLLQNALLELKKSAIRTLEHDDFFQIFGEGFHPQWRELYHRRVRPELSSEYRAVWDRRINFFDGSARRKSFYFRGTSGFFAWMINGYLNRPRGLREAVKEILSAETTEEQSYIFESRDVSRLLFSKPMQWALRRDTTMAMLGVPRSQRQQIENGYAGGIGRFIQDRIETVFRKMPLKDNYFWRVYLTGKYSRTCCPEYLTEQGFQNLKSGMVDRVSTHTATVQSFLAQHDATVSRFVLLDHMDWLYERHPQSLADEWQSIVDRAAPNSRVLWRSAALRVDFVDSLSIRANGRQVTVGELLHYHPELAAELHARDRVNTYGSFYVADIGGVAA